MAAKESTSSSADYSYQDPHEDEETLSLCDLPIHRNSDSWDDDDDFSGSSKKYQSSASNDDDEEEDDFFEFFSENFTASTYPNNREIIFCGKLITLAGQEDQQKPTHAQDLKSGQKSLPEKPRRRKRSIFQYLLKPGSNESKALTSYDSEVRVAKVPVVRSKAVKSRWFLFMFGMVKVPAEMKLRDMRTRQKRRTSGRSHSATTFSSFEEEKKKETTAEKVSSKWKGKRGFWGMLRALRSRTRHAEVVAKAAYGCRAANPKE